VKTVGLQFRWGTFLAALTLLAAGAAAMWIAYPPVYQTNDDVAIRLALEGRTAPGEPATGFTVLTHAALGWPVAYLYGLFPNTPWWDLVVASMLIVALAVVCAIGWQGLGGDWFARATAVGVLLVAAVPLLTIFQFTVGATLGGGAAVLLAVVETGRTKHPRRSVVLMAVLVLLCALLVRTLGAAAGVVAAGLFCIPLVLARVVAVRPTAFVVGAAVALCVVAQYADSIAYMAYDDWGRHQRYQWMIVRLFEWRGELSQAETDVIRASAEWTGNDWRMVQGYFSVDPNLHGYDRIARAYEMSMVSFGWADWFAWAGARLRAIDLATLSSIVERSVAPLVVMLAAVVGYASRRGTAVVVCIAFLFLGYCLGIETAFKELPVRLLGPLQVCAVAASVIAVSALRRQPSPVPVILALGLVLSVLEQQLMDTVAAAEAATQEAQALDQEVNELLRLSPSLLVLHADTFPREEWWRPFHRPAVELPAIALGWNNQNPLLQEFLRKTGRDGLFQAMCTDPSVLVIAEEGRLDVVTIFFREHYNSQIMWTEAYRGSFPAWRCSLVEPSR
jgi:hypothetical protein